MVKCAEVAATIHANMCNDPKFGYTQGSGRGGTGGDKVTGTIDGRKYVVNRGDYDCSSSVITAGKKALEGTPYEGKLDRATYTGNMRRVFVESGLFDVGDTFTTYAQRGDIYLNDKDHVAMCQSGINPDTLSEFGLNEYGTIVNGRTGDQTGGESRIVNYYNFPGNCTLHYNGKADVEIDNLKDAYDFLTAKTDASGRNKEANMRDRLDGMAKYQEDMQESINKLNAKATTLLDKLNRTDNMLRAVDISSWQEGISPAALDCDIVIIKVTGGTQYVNPYWKKGADEVLKSGKLLGLYHFAYEKGCHGTPQTETDHFLNEVKDYIGKFVPILDGENDAISLPVSGARKWLDIVAQKTGATPIFYAYASNVNSTDYSLVSKYPLGMASYLDRYKGAGGVTNPVNTGGTGSGKNMLMYQYTSTGYVKGYSNRLDLSIFYGNKSNGTQLEGDDVSDAYDFLTAKTDASGRGKKSDMRDRLAWMAKKQEDMQDSIDALEKKLDAILAKLK